MFGKIKFISGNVAHVETICSAEEMGDLMNVHVVFEEKDQAILGEVEEVTDEVIKISINVKTNDLLDFTFSMIETLCREYYITITMNNLTFEKFTEKRWG